MSGSGRDTDQSQTELAQLNELFIHVALAKPEICAHTHTRYAMLKRESERRLFVFQLWLFEGDARANVCSIERKRPTVYHHVFVWNNTSCLSGVLLTLVSSWYFSLWLIRRTAQMCYIQMRKSNKRYIIHLLIMWCFSYIVSDPQKFQKQ